VFTLVFYGVNASVPVVAVPFTMLLLQRLRAAMENKFPLIHNILGFITTWAYVFLPLFILAESGGPRSPFLPAYLCIPLAAYNFGGNFVSSLFCNIGGVCALSCIEFSGVYTFSYTWAAPEEALRFLMILISCGLQFNFHKLTKTALKQTAVAKAHFLTNMSHGSLHLCLQFNLIAITCSDCQHKFLFSLKAAKT